MPVYLRTVKQLTKEQRESVKRAWKARYSGVANAGNTPLMPPGVSVEKIGLAPTDLKILENVKIGEKEIAVAFGVPPLLLNDLENTKYDSAPAQERVFAKYVLVPKLQSISDVVNKQVLPLLGRLDVEFKWNYKSIPELSEANLQQEVMYDRRIRNGSMTINERRAIDGEPAVSWGDTFWGPEHTIAIAQLEKTNKNIKNLINFVKKQHTGDTIKYKALYRQRISTINSESEKLIKEIKKLVDKGKDKKTIAKKMVPYLLSFAQQAGDSVIDNYKVDKAWIDILAQKVAENVNNKNIDTIITDAVNADNNHSILDAGRQKNIKEKIYMSDEENVKRYSIDATFKESGLVIPDKGIIIINE